MMIPTVRSKGNLSREVRLGAEANNSFSSKAAEAAEAADFLEVDSNLRKAELAGLISQAFSERLVKWKSKRRALLGKAPMGRAFAKVWILRLHCADLRRQHYVTCTLYDVFHLLVRGACVVSIDKRR